MTVTSTGTSAIRRVDDYFTGTFQAMASPCSVLVDTDDAHEAAGLLDIAEAEARRIEEKFSRYRTDNIVHRINHAEGCSVAVDEETASLISYGAMCYEMSEGLFDITSGVLRRIWKFDGGNRVPKRDDVERCLRDVGWSRVTWAPPVLTIPAGMEIDFGGIGKEYAVDRAAALIRPYTKSSYVVNFGGDLYASGLRRGDRTWAIGIDDPKRSGEKMLVRMDVPFGGVATSGDAHRFVWWRGKRLGHILNPRTGWPVVGAPHSVTVVGRTCMEAGTLSTLAYLQGPHAAEYLANEGVQYWIV